MKLTRRTRGIGLVAVGSAMAFLFSAVGANAATTNWKAGYFPNCDFVFYGSGYQMSDFTKPKVASFVPTPVVRVGTAAATKTWGKARVTDSCSGVTGVYADALRGSTDHYFASPTVPQGQWWNYSFTLAKSTNAGDLGKYIWPSVRTYDRWQYFELNDALDTVSNEEFRPSTGGNASELKRYSTSISSSKATYVLRDTKLTVAKNKSTIKKGKSVTVSGTLTVANGAVYEGLDISKVSLQRRYAGSTKWATVGSDIADGNGKVAISHKPGKNVYYRLVYTGKYSAPWNAPRTTSSTSKVTVKQ